MGAAVALSALFGVGTLATWSAEVPSATLLTLELSAIAGGLFAIGRAGRLDGRPRSDVIAGRAGLRADLVDVLMDTSPASLILIGEDFRVLKANESAKRAHGSPLENRYCYEALAQRSVRCETCIAASGATTEHRSQRTGETLRVSGFPVEMGARQCILLVEEALAERRKLDARHAHREKMAALGQLAAGFAHDIGNPLSSIGTQLQLLTEEEQLSERGAATVATVRREVARLGRILLEMTAFSRRRHDQLSLVRVETVVREAVGLLRFDPRARRCAISQSFDPPPPSVRMVEDHLMQVVLNLLLNAVASMPEGGTLHVSARDVGGRLELSVRDSGHGMDPAVRHHCTEPGYTTRSEQGGSGLGLSLARDIIEAAGGAIEIRSTPGHGTEVLVSLPAANAAAAEGHRESARAPSGGRGR